MMNTITETVLHWGVNAERQAPWDLTEVMDCFALARATIPSEYRHTARIDFDPHYDHESTYAQVRVTYDRPTTEEERLEAEKEELDHWCSQMDEAENRVAYCREQLERLSCQ